MKFEVTYLKCVCYRGEHFWIYQAPNDAKQRIHPFDGFGDQVHHGGFASLLFT